MSDSSAPRRPYGLPSNPRQAASLKNAKSQSSIVQRAPEPSQRSSAPSRARSRSRDPTASSSRDRASSTSRTAPRSRYPPSSSRSVVSSVSSDYGAPREDMSSLRSRPKASWNSPPRPSNRQSYERRREELSSPEPEPEGTMLANRESTEAAPLWKQVVTTLTVNVSKAISSTVGEGDGEATPVGAESRLTKAMKTYYLSKARDQSDLPDWLFNERERRVTSSRRQKSRGRGESPTREDTREAPRPPRHRTVMSEEFTPRPPPTTRTQPNSSASTRKDFRTAGNTADRLAALRERGRHVGKAASTSRIPVGGGGR